MLLLVLIFVLAAFGLLLVALVTGTAAWAWISVVVSVAAAGILVYDWAQRRAAVKSGNERTPVHQPSMPRSPLEEPPTTAIPTYATNPEPATEVFPALRPSYGPGPSGAGSEKTSVMRSPSGSAERPSGAEPTGGASADQQSQGVTVSSSTPPKEADLTPSAPSGEAAGSAEQDSSKVADSAEATTVVSAGSGAAAAKGLSGSRPGESRDSADRKDAPEQKNDGDDRKAAPQRESAARPGGGGADSRGGGRTTPPGRDNVSPWQPRSTDDRGTEDSQRPPAQQSPAQRPPVQRPAGQQQPAAQGPKTEQPSTQRPPAQQSPARQSPAQQPAAQKTPAESTSGKRDGGSTPAGGPTESARPATKDERAPSVPAGGASPAASDEKSGKDAEKPGQVGKDADRAKSEPDSTAEDAAAIAASDRTTALPIANAQRAAQARKQAAAQAKTPLENAEATQAITPVKSGPPADPGEEKADPAASDIVAGLSDQVLVIDEQPRYHVLGCRVLNGHETIPLPAKEAVEYGFSPCAVCTPVRVLAARNRAASSS